MPSAGPSQLEHACWLPALPLAWTLAGLLAGPLAGPRPWTLAGPLAGPVAWSLAWPLDLSQKQFPLVICLSLASRSSHKIEIASKCI